MASFNDSQPRRKLQSIQVVRGLAALLVVGYHLTENCEMRYCKTQLLAVFEEFAFAGVDLFFVISGVVMVLISHDKLGTGRGGGAFLWRRVLRIYPLYWIVTTVLFAVMLIVPALARRTEMSVAHVVSSYLLLPQSIYPILAPGWTLVFEMYFYVIFALLFLLPRRALPYMLACWAVVTIGSYFVYDNPSYSDTTALLQLPVFAFPLTLEFIAGCFVGLLIARGSYRYATVCLVIGISWFIVGGPVVELLLSRQSEFGHSRVLSFGIASTLIMYGLVARESHRDTPLQPTWLTKLGDASYSLYLTHMLVMHAAGVVWSRLQIESTFAQVLFLIGTTSMCIVVGFATYYVVERPLLRLTSRSERREVATAS